MYWYFYVIVGVCLIFSAFFSSADMAYGVVDHLRLEKEAEKGRKAAKVALALAKDYEFTISGILFGNNVANIFASSIVTIIGLSYNNENFTSGELVATIILTVIIIIFCEFAPKIVAKRFSLGMSILYAYPVLFFKYLTFVFVKPIALLFTLVSKMFRKKSKEESVIDEEVLNEMVDAIEEEGLFEENEAEIIRSAIDLNDIQAFEIMTPRVDVYFLDIEDDINEIIKNGEILEYSRIPVFSETVDNIIGILPVKALTPYIIKKEPIDVKKLMYTPIKIPRNRQVLDLLSEFKESKIHIAIVMDEYGGTEGIVTMEDILEEIVGDIFDENDEIDEEYIEKGHGVYILDGGMNIDDAFELINYEEAEEVKTDYTTIGGFCQEILDRFAKKGDVFNFSHYRFTILEADDYSVEKLKIEDLEWKKEDDE